MARPEDRVAVMERQVSFLQGACGLLLGLAITSLWLTPQGCDGHTNEKANPELPVLEPVARDGIGDASRQRRFDPSGKEFPGRPEAVSQSAKHPHRGIVATSGGG